MFDGDTLRRRSNRIGERPLLYPLDAAGGVGHRRGERTGRVVEALYARQEAHAMSSVARPDHLPADAELHRGVPRRASTSRASRSTLPDVVQQPTEDELIAIIGDFDGMIAGDDPLTARVLEHATRMRIISKWGVGTDGIDFEAARAHGIRVTNTPGRLRRRRRRRRRRLPRDARPPAAPDRRVGAQRRLVQVRGPGADRQDARRRRLRQHRPGRRPPRPRLRDAASSRTT